MSREKYKPLSFSTTMRNPNRIADFLNCLLPFENKILTNEIILEVVKKVIKLKIYRPKHIPKSSLLMEIYNSDTEEFTDEMLDEIIEKSPQEHKEAGFDKGWPSRFDTWYKLPMEFGFVRYEIGKPIIISNVGQMLINALNENPVNGQKIQNVFLNSMMKYQINNPFRKNKNSNVPLVLLLQVIKMFKNENPNNPGIFRNELSFFICWPTNNAKALFTKIKSFRETHRFGKFTDELIYDECLKILGAGAKDKKYFKMSQITGEAVDEYIRKMRSTGIISLRGNGRFIDFNMLEIEKINYVLKNYSEYSKFDTKDQYFEYMGTIDNKILELHRNMVINEASLKKETLLKYAAEYDKASVFMELKSVCNKKESKDPVLRVISSPVRLEFLVSISLIQNFEGLDVNPNYIIDDEGLPTCTALGNMSDIVCHYNFTDSLVEVTLMCGRQQVNNEMLPICRHLSEAKKTNENTFSVFIAPRIFEDVERYIKFVKNDENLTIKAYGINDFINIIDKCETIEEMVNVS